MHSLHRPVSCRQKSIGKRRSTGYASQRENRCDFISCIVLKGSCKSDRLCIEKGGRRALSLFYVPIKNPCLPPNFVVQNVCEAPQELSFRCAIQSISSTVSDEALKNALPSTAHSPIYIGLLPSSGGRNRNRMMISLFSVNSTRFMRLTNSSRLLFAVSRNA